MGTNLRRVVATWAIAGGSVVAVLATPAAAATATASCEVEAMPLPTPARESAVTVGDPSGRWLGGYRLDGPDGEAVSEALLWHDGALVPLEPALDVVAIKGINRHGVFVGVGYDTSGEFRPFAFVDGATVFLAEPDGASYTTVTGVSANGTVVGFADTPDGEPFAVTWSLERPDDVTALRVPPRTRYSKAEAVSGRGTIAVDARMPDNRSRVFLFNRNGKRTELHGLVDGSSLEVRDIANGWLVGYERDDFGAEHTYSVRFDLHGDSAERVPVGGSVNASGTVAGQLGEDAALYTDEVVSLPALDGELNGADVASVDRDGQPAGQSGASAADASVAVRWHCD